MADHQIFQTFKQSFSLADIDSDVEFINTFSGLYQNHEDYSSAFNFNNSINNILPQLSSSVGHGSFENGVLSQAMISPNDDDHHKERKRKAIMDLSTTESTCSYSSPQVSDHSGSRKKNPGGGGGGRGKKVSRKGEEKPREVVHVRAKRGQATDSHSLAERVRRGKINERLRCLQDIVPGCYKTMGMAVMLDEIINYVQSLQNQVEFLSMKLAAASTFYDFNADKDAMEELMQRANAFEAMKSENVANQGLPSAQIGQNLSYCPQLPDSR